MLLGLSFFNLLVLFTNKKTLQLMKEEDRESGEREEETDGLKSTQIKTLTPVFSR